MPRPPRRARRIEVGLFRESRYRHQCLGFGSPFKSGRIQGAMSLEFDPTRDTGKRAESLAKSDGVSLDQFIATALAEKVAVLDADTYLRNRAARGSREKFDRVLAKVPNVEPEENDRL